MTPSDRPVTAKDSATARRLAPDPIVHPWVIVDSDGQIAVTRRSNGLAFALTYGTQTAARQGLRRWGGTVARRDPTTGSPLR